VEEKAKSCARLISEAGFIVALTGAGISTNAGIPDFRGPEGIYTTGKYNPEIFDIEYFLYDPKPFYDFARDFINLSKKIKPTFTHYFLAHLEKMGKLKGIITQNIDTLHQKAGSKNVLELHGSLGRSYCLKCNREFSYDEMEKNIFKKDVPRCSCGGVIKPDIVFFGELVKHLNEAEELAYKSDLLFIIGSSLAIYPAGMIPDMAGNRIVVVNKQKVNIPPAKVTLFVQEDTDWFFKKVSDILGLKMG